MMSVAIQKNRYDMIFSLGRGIGTLAIAGLVAGAALAPLSAVAQDYPNKTVTMVVPFVAGGMVDATGRLLAERLSEDLGQQFIVENRPGAAGSIGYSNVARAEKDGYTLLVGYSTTSTCSPAIFSNLTWKNEDFAPIASFSEFPMAVTVHPSLNVNTLEELIAYLKAHPGEVSYGALGVGTQVHIATELFKQMTGTKMEAVQYKGSGEVIADLLAGNVQLVIDALGPYRQHVEAGNLKTLAVAAETRDPNSPDIPTTAEAGLEGFTQSGFMPIFAPAGTDPAVIAKLTEAIQKASEENEAFRAKVSSVKLTNNFRDPGALKDVLEKLSSECAEVVKSAGITIE